VTTKYKETQFSTWLQAAFPLEGPALLISAACLGVLAKSFDGF
jgi:hypothetical protein